MGLTFSRSIRFGPARFNFSGSGIGVSIGVPGLRIGTGPRGAYISGGYGGFRYRQSLSTWRSKGSRPASPLQPPSVSPGSAPVLPNVVASTNHDDKDLMKLGASNADELVETLNSQAAKSPMWPWTALAAAAFVCWLWTITKEYAPALHLGVTLLLAVAVGFVYWRDTLGRLTVLFFDLEPRVEAVYQTLTQSFETAASARKLQTVETTSQYADRKYSAGASQGLKLAKAVLSFGQPPGIAANISVPLLKSVKTTLAFMPDRVLAIQGSKVVSFSYLEIDAFSQDTSFIESETVPSDATVVDITWAYVNKNGGPDRRFKNNREIPVCLYNRCNLSTASGLDLQFLASKPSAFQGFSAALASMRGVT
jgi:hypothetical protein